MQGNLIAPNEVARVLATELPDHKDIHQLAINHFLIGDGVDIRPAIEMGIRDSVETKDSVFELTLYVPELEMSPGNIVERRNQAPKQEGLSF